MRSIQRTLYIDLDDFHLLFNYSSIFFFDFIWHRIANTRAPSIILTVNHNFNQCLRLWRPFDYLMNIDSVCFFLLFDLYHRQCLCDFFLRSNSFVEIREISIETRASCRHDTVCIGTNNGTFVSE